jgi:hypothetical protein
MCAMAESFILAFSARTNASRLRAALALVTTQATVQGRAGFGLRHDVPAFAADKGNFRRPKGEGSGPLGPDGGLDLPSTVRFQPAPTASALTYGP